MGENGENAIEEKTSKNKGSKDKYNKEAIKIKEINQMKRTKNETMKKRIN